ncbi:MAG: hypothetical protein ACLUEQ_03755 [Cloacibacillus evryensis]
MYIKLKNIGVMRQAVFEPGNMTIICGQNNTGKTYATYTLYGFHSFWNKSYVIDDINDSAIDNLLANGVAKLDLQKYADTAQKLVTRACQQYSRNIAHVFSANLDYFKDSAFSIELNDASPDVLTASYKSMINTAKGSLFSITKETSSSILIVSCYLKGINLASQAYIKIIYQRCNKRGCIWEKLCYAVYRKRGKNGCGDFQTRIELCAQSTTGGIKL